MFDDFILPMLLYIAEVVNLVPYQPEKGVII